MSKFAKSRMSQGASPLRISRCATSLITANQGSQIAKFSAFSNRGAQDSKYSTARQRSTVDLWGNAGHLHPFRLTSIEFRSKVPKSRCKDFRHNLEVIPVICPNGCVIRKDRVVEEVGSSRSGPNTSRFTKGSIFSADPRNTRLMTKTLNTTLLPDFDDK